MEINSPHLPPKTCNVVWYRRLQSLPGLLVVMALSAIVGVTASLTAVGWIIPSFIPSQSVNIFGLNQNAKAEVAPTLLRYISERSVVVYDRRKKIGLAYYNSSSALGRAALLSSDGWAVMYNPAYYAGAEYNWDVLDMQGAPIKIKKTVFDRTNGLLYLQLEGSGFRIFSLADWNDLEAGNHGWITTKDSAEYVTLGDIAKTDGNNYSNTLWKQQYVFDISANTKTNYQGSSIIINEQGALIGLAGPAKQIVPGFWVGEHIRSLLSSGQLNIQSVSVLGNYIDVSVQEVGIENARPFSKGFYVTQKIAPFIVGDVIVSIQNKPIDPVFTPFYIFSSPEQVTMTVLREGKPVDVTAQKKLVR